LNSDLTRKHQAKKVCSPLKKLTYISQKLLMIKQRIANRHVSWS